jgi:TonB family protein
MTELLDAAGRASVPVVVALLACVLLRERSAAFRHAVLTAAAVGAASVIPLSVTLPSWVPAFPVAVGVSLESSAAAVVRASDAVSEATADVFPAVTGVTRFLFVVWILGVLAGAGLLLIALARLVRMTARAERVADGPWRRLATKLAARHGIKRSIDLLAARDSVVATWGPFKPRVLLPADARTWSEARIEVALCHELAHVQRCDWAIQMGADLLRIVFWFNPLFWILCSRLRHESERACDEAVLETGIPAEAYASSLAEIARACRQGHPWLPSMSIGRPSTLEGRIAAMLNTSLNRQAPTRRAIAVVLTVLVAVVIPTSSFDVSAQGSGPLALTGYVYDSWGGVLPGVELKLTDERLLEWSTVTDGQGRFAFTPVYEGKYVLEVALPGFQSLRDEFTLLAARDWNRNITMQVGALEETVTVTARRPTQPPQVSSVAAVQPIRVGGQIKAPHKLKHVSPVYPPSMRDAGLEGVVPMEALIGVEGTVASVRVLSAQVHPAFAGAAEDAVRQWMFSSTLLNGDPVQVQMTVSVKFSLED